jgi:hypothetical protein
MIRRILFLTIALISLSAESQNLIGLKSAEIKAYMKNNYKEMMPENVVNSRFSYLKYTDNTYTSTLLFFMDKDSICKSIRLICDPAIKNEKLNQLNAIYKKSGDNRWMDSRDGKDFIVELKDDKWSFTITFEPSKQSE